MGFTAGGRLETLYEICGSKCAVLYKFRYMLKDALESLKAVGFLHSWEYGKAADTITVIRCGPVRAIEMQASLDL